MHSRKSSPSRRRSTSPSQHVELTPEALGFLELLQDLGHLDDVLFEQVLESISKALVPEGATHVLVSLDDVRRLVASMLMEQEAKLEDPQRQLLEREWALLFS